MKKIIIGFIMFFLIIWVSFADSVATSVPDWTSTSWISECINVSSHWVIHYGIPNTNEPLAQILSSVWVPCTAHTYYASSDYPKPVIYNNWWITECWSWEKVIAYDSWTNIMTCRKYDDTPPTNFDITSNNSGNLLANSSYSYLLSISTSWWSPIVQVDWSMEYYENETTMNSFSDTSFPWNQSWDIRKVDNYRNQDWTTARQYKFRLTKICDQAWNCWNWPYDYYHNVYANSSLSYLSWGITQNDLDDMGNIADWSEKNLTIKLEDIYGNDIIPTPSSWIWRTVDLSFDTENDVYLNQYEKTWNWIYLNTTNSWSFLNRIWTWSQSTTFISQSSSNWAYPFKFKIYIPTKESYDKSDSNLHFTNIQASISNIYDSSWNWNTSIIDWNFSLRSKPLYYTTLSWEIIDNGFIDWWQQENNIKISENESFLTSNNKLYLEFGSWDLNYINTNLNLKAWTISWTLNLTLVWEWNPNFSIFTGFTTPIIFPLYTYLRWVWTLNDIQSSYFSTHIWYEIDDPNWWPSKINPIYNSDVYNKTSYWGIIWTGWTYASAVKIIWKTYSKDYKEILAGQSGTDVKLLNWNITKSGLKTEVRRNAYNIIKNTPLSNSWNIINNSNFIDNVDWVKLLSWSMIYFGWLNGANVSINSLLTFEGNKTILIEWGNLYINWNIDVSWSKSMLSIVVLKDRNWKGWNIYINPSVLFIKATMYADKSLISFDGINELDWYNSSFSTLKNQLYIYGSVFSENTIGWSRSSPIKCPYYVHNCSNQEIAQKYDLNYLRRYYLKDTNSDWKGDTPAWWWSSSIPYITATSPNYKYPVVIQYNPLIQTNPSILFRLK